MMPRRAIHTISGEFRMLFARSAPAGALSGQAIADWEAVFADYLGVKHAMAVGSGRGGMRLILDSLGLNAGDEVVVPSYTLEALLGIIRSLGLVCVPADVDPRTFNITPESILENITARTRVIIATHIFGSPCRMDGIMQIAADRGIMVIEDCAHAAGAEFKGRKTGSLGNAAFFSLETIKPLNTYGGGMIATDNEELADKMRRKAARLESESRVPWKKFLAARLEQVLLDSPVSFLPLYFLSSRYWSGKVYELYRINQRLSASRPVFSPFQAYLGREKIKSLGERIAGRRRQAGLLKGLLDPKIKPQCDEAGAVPNYYFFVALLAVDPWRIRRMLLLHGIDAGIGREIADLCVGRRGCPHAARVSQSAIQLPLHEGVSERDIRRMAGVLNKLVNAY